VLTKETTSWVFSTT